MIKKTGHPLVTCVVPAYNEAKTIGRVLKVLLSAKRISEIVVIDDGSTDDTLAIAKKTGIRCFRLPTNSGKSNAVKKIIPELKTDIIFFCDADLNDLTPEICDQIIQPLIEKKASMSVGLRDYGSIINFMARFAPSVSGERALFYKDVLACTQSPDFHNWGMEVIFNHYFHVNKLRVVKKAFPYSHTRQIKKKGFIKGGWAWFLQAIEIIKTSVIQFTK
jgi:polyisoprenyl-phosphate glycosyltransferase